MTRRPTGLAILIGVVLLGSVASASAADFRSTGGLGAPRTRQTATLLPTGKVLIAGGCTGGCSSAAEYPTTAELYDPASGTFSPAGSLRAARANHTATLLPDGTVLIAGGWYGGAAYLNSAEIYDPATAQFRPTVGRLLTARGFHTGTLLPNGTVLVAGGYNGAFPAQAELYDPVEDTFSAVGSLQSARFEHTATLLRSGRVLLAGGSGAAGIVNAAELYDPLAGTFSSTTGGLITARFEHTATLLPNGKVLIAGGFGISLSSPWLASAELFDPASGTFSPTAGNLQASRRYHTATLLPNGRVLIAGGEAGLSVPSAELFDPATGAFSPTDPLVTARYTHTATLLPGGTVLLAGGQGAAGILSAAELFDPASGTFSPTTGPLSAARYLHTATLLPSGKVLIASGYGAAGSGLTAAAELYDAVGGTFSSTTGPLVTARQDHTATLLPNGKVLIAGGYGAAGSSQTAAELYDPVGGTFSPTTGPLSAARRLHTATLLPSGKVLMAGGYGSSGVYPTAAELYDPASGTFSATGSLTPGRQEHTATLLPNGKVLVTGGWYSPGGVDTFLTSAHVYDPASGIFSPTTGGLTIARAGHTATLLPNGKVLIAGGYYYVSGPDTYPAAAELYDPASGTFSPTTGGLITGRSYHTATLLPNGKVLIAGGTNPDPSLTQAELYDPASGTFSPTGVATNRSGCTATLLPNGKVLIAGGYFGRAVFPTAAELYDAGLAYTEASRPVVSAPPTPFSLNQPAAVTLSGSGFAGLSEASGGVTNGSATNYPLLHLQRVDNNQTMFVSPAAWTDTTFTSTAVSGLASGHYRLTVFTNAIPSLQRLVSITSALTITHIGPDAGPTAGGQAVTIFGANLSPATAVTFGGAAAPVQAATAGAITVLAPPGAAGAVDVVVTTAGGSVTAALGYTYVAFGPALTFSATATGTASVALTWSAVSGATGYEVWRSWLGGPYALVLSTSGTSATDSGLSANTTYLYKVRAIDGGGASPFGAIDPATTVLFTDPSLTGIVVKAVHLTELRTAVNALRGAAGLGPATFTTATMTPRSTVVRQVHLAELRAALDAARLQLWLPPLTYTDPTLTPAVTVIKAAHVLELRAGVR